MTTMSLRKADGRKKRGINSMMKMIGKCPECGVNVYLSKDKPDGYFMGWSIGCTRYKMNDGIHKDKMAFHNFTEKAHAIEYWERWVCGKFRND